MMMKNEEENDETNTNKAKNNNRTHNVLPRFPFEIWRL